MARERTARPRAPPFIDPPGYARHRPAATLLYQLVERYYPELAAARRPLPKYVQEEFAAYLKCGRLEHGFLRVRCEDCHAEKLVAFSCKRRGFCPSCGARRMTDSAALLADEVLPRKPLRQWLLSLPFALRFLLATNGEALTQVLGIVYRTISAHVLKKARLTLIQRFASALNLNIHFHMLVLDGAYLVGTEPPVFRRIAAPGEAELQALVERLAERVGRALEQRRGVLMRDTESSFLELDAAAGGAIDDLLGHSITYRVAVGPQGRKCFRCRRYRREERDSGKVSRSTRGSRSCRDRCRSRSAGEARTTRPLHEPAAGVGGAAVADGAGTGALSAEDAVSRRDDGHRAGAVGLHRAPGRAGAATARAFDEVPRSVRGQCRAAPAGRGSKARSEPERPMPKHVALNWARWLKRVFGIEIEHCARCGGRLEVIASIEESELIERILAHRRERGEEGDGPTCSLGARAPPQAWLF
jgi:hypothetical protein